MPAQTTPPERGVVWARDCTSGLQGAGFQIGCGMTFDPFFVHLWGNSISAVYSCPICVMAFAPEVETEFTYLDGEPHDNLQCQICFDAARDPHQHICGKIFCSKCLDRHGRQKPCPNCRKDPRTDPYFPDVRSK